jgi:hypothetical protein
VVDEFHHAAASTYRRVIARLRPKFLLGLTATPDRGDGADLLALCQENLVFQRGIAEGIGQGQLCPFRYFGVPDRVDYTNIPWRNARFDIDALDAAVATEARAANALAILHAYAMNSNFKKCDMKEQAAWVMLALPRFIPAIPADKAYFDAARAAKEALGDNADFDCIPTHEYATFGGYNADHAFSAAVGVVDGRVRDSGQSGTLGGRDGRLDGAEQDGADEDGDEDADHDTSEALRGLFAAHGLSQFLEVHSFFVLRNSECWL